MRFLVDITVVLPEEMRDPESERRKALFAAERERGLELRRSGVIEHIWRVPGQLRNVGIWSTDDADQLHEALSSLPLASWLQVAVIPLAEHPLEREFRAQGATND